MSEIYTVFDVGTRWMRVAIAKHDPRHGLSVLGFTREDLRGVVDSRGVANIEQMVSAIRRALVDIQKQSSIAVSRVWVSLTHSNLRGERANAIVTFPETYHEVRQTDLQRLRIQAIHRPVPAGYRLLHAIPLRYALDQRTGLANPVGMSGIRLEGEYYLIYAPQDYLATLERCFERAEVQIEGFVLGPLLAAQALLGPEEQSAGVAYLDIGAHHTTLVLFYEQVLQHLVVLPLAGQSVTDDIRDAIRRILPPQAETLKLRLGMAYRGLLERDEVISFSGDRLKEPLELRRSFLVEVIQARLQEILDFVAAEIDRVGLLKELHAGILLGGGSVAMPGFRELTEYVLGCTVHLAQPEALINAGIREPFSSPDMACLAGTLALLPTYREFLAPLSQDIVESSLPNKAAHHPASKAKGPGFFQRFLSYIEQQIKIPSDLID